MSGQYALLIGPCTTEYHARTYRFFVGCFADDLPAVAPLKRGER